LFELAIGRVAHKQSMQLGLRDDAREGRIDEFGDEVISADALIQ
jgi:hypothetical protein